MASLGFSKRDIANLRGNKNLVGSYMHATSDISLHDDEEGVEDIIGRAGSEFSD